MRIAWKSIGWGLIIVLLLIFLAGGLAARHYWVQLLQQNGIETLSWKGIALSTDGLALEDLEVRQSGPSGDLVVTGKKLEASWLWPEEGWQPQWHHLKARQLRVDWYPEKKSQKPVSQSGQQISSPTLPSWLPAEIEIRQFNATAPCGADRCTLSGSLSMNSTPSTQAQPEMTRRLLVQARVSKPWPVPGIGQVKGDLEAELLVEQGHWHPQRLQTDLELSQPGKWVQSLPEPWRPELLSLAIRSAETMPPPASGSPLSEGSGSPDLLPLQLSLHSSGGAEVNADSHLAITTSAPWVIRLGETRLDASYPELTAAGWVLIQPRVRAVVTGWLSTTTASLVFDQSTKLKVARLSPVTGRATGTNNKLQVDSLGIQMAGTRLHARYQQVPPAFEKLALSGPVVVKAGQIQHPQLQPLAWVFNGNIDSNFHKTRVKGLLRAGSGTTANLDVDFPYQGPVHLNGKMRVSGEDEAEALSRVLADWPPLLDVSGGTVSADINLHQSLQRAQPRNLNLSAGLTFVEWSGLYDRTAWEGVNGSINIQLQDSELSIDTQELTIEQVNPGLPLGPIQLAGNYQAPLAELSRGTLTFEKAFSEALGGEIHVQPGSWDLAQAPVTIPVELQQLSLTRLLQLYPAEGLAGTGILSGTVPVLFDPLTGIEIDRGRIDALKPGGRLQLTADRLKALASQNETMKVVTRALEDFHYSVLDSGIDYDGDGTLVLTLHLKGRNPEVGDGRPVVLNINLEENIPALLKSLQLSGNVSERVKDRVRNLLERRQQNSDDS